MRSTRKSVARLSAIPDSDQMAAMSKGEKAEADPRTARHDSRSSASISLQGICMNGKTAAWRDELGDETAN